MSEVNKSDFQMVKFGIQSIHYDASTWNVKGSDYNSTITATPNITYRSESANWLATIHLIFELNPKEEPAKETLPSMKFLISAFSVFTMDGKENTEDKQRLEQLLKLNGMISTIGALRSLLIILSMQLGISPPIIFPNIDLRKFEWDTDTTE